MKTSSAWVRIVVWAWLAGCGDGAGTPPWHADLAPAAQMGVRRGLTPARGIVHLHSAYSHDACDGEPRDANGVPNEPCITHLRDALCTTSMDYAALTDHGTSMADEDWGPPLFVARGNDELVLGQNGQPVASRLLCADGHRVLVFVGGENALMPVMLNEHPPGDVTTRHGIYSGQDLASADALRAAGGWVFVAHTEQQPLDVLRDVQVSGVEAYNLHAAIAPDIRAEYLGLDGPKAIRDALQFNVPDASGPEPDLAFISFLEPQTPSLAKWDTLLGESRRVVGTAGTDAHENALPIELRDGERMDSYRRMMRWFSNVVLAADPTDPAEIKDALGQGRSFIAFEVLGTPAGFDFRAEAADASVFEMGDELTVADGATLVLEAPSVANLPAEFAAPALTTKIVRVDANGTSEVASGTGALSVVATEPGAYRAEVWMVPAYLDAYLGSLRNRGYAQRAYPWIYANPIYVRP